MSTANILSDSIYDDGLDDLYATMPIISPTLSPSNALNSLPPPTTSTTSDDSAKRALLTSDTLPIVKCTARARIPTTNGVEIFLHLYTNNVDDKEHLAIVFGEDIRSKSLFHKRLGESQSDRMTRGAYVGRLCPGRRIADIDSKLGLKLQFDENGNITNDTVDDDTDDNDSNLKPASIWNDETLVRIHSECYTGETAWSARCDCGEQFDEAGRLMGLQGHGVIVYLRQEGRGIGLGEKLKAYNLQDLGADTVQANLLLRHPADKRSFSLATAILVDLGISKVRLLTNNPDKIIAVEGKDRLVEVVERVPMVPKAWLEANGGVRSVEVEGYLRTKIERMGHLLSKPE